MQHATLTSDLDAHGALERHLDEVLDPAGHRGREQQRLAGDGRVLDQLLHLFLWWRGGVMGVDVVR